MEYWSTNDHNTVYMLCSANMLFLIHTYAKLQEVTVDELVTWSLISTKAKRQLRFTYVITL